jgi:bifunctional UDP-N-acetylglucosamine pyrophosphorylase/glucosamine-1-phosphate N-acetyltransferase
MERLLIIPAAGRGSRLQCDIPKVLYPIAGRPMIDHLLELYQDVINEFVLVLSSEFDALVRKHCSAYENLAQRVGYVIQHHPNGMLPAILLATPMVEYCRPKSVWITWCDQVGIRPTTIQRLLQLTADHPRADLIFPTAQKKYPYIHFDRDSHGKVNGVRQRREGDPMPEVGEGDSGLFALSLDAYLGHLPAFASATQNGAETGERNFIPFIPWIAKHGTVVTYPVQDVMESTGVNTTADAQSIEEYLARR